MVAAGHICVNQMTQLRALRNAFPKALKYT